MPKKNWLALGFVFPLLMIAAAVGLYAFNGAPQPPPVSLDSAPGRDRPTVIKVHARWCPVCMMGKSAWSQLDRDYSGRVNLVVFDVTNRKAVEASREKAQQLGLREFFDAHADEVGTVFILPADSKEVSDSVPGLSKLAVYRAAVDTVIERRSGAPAKAN